MQTQMSSMSLAEFEPAISVIEQLKTYVFDRTATGIGLRVGTRNNTSGLQTCYITAQVASDLSPYVAKHTEFQKRSNKRLNL